MGRWAQRNRAGGTVNNFASMMQVTVSAGLPTQAVIDYTPGGNLALLSSGDFTSEPSGQSGNFQIVSGTNQLTVAFPLTILADTTLTYEGNVVGFLTPQVFVR